MEAPLALVTAATRPTVLIVDDSGLVRAQFRRALGTEFRVLEAGDGAEALDLLLASPDISLVICDVNMPNVGGLELLRRIRETEALASLTFVFLTTESQPDLIDRGKALAARAWILKPFKADLMLATVRKLTSRPAAGTPCTS